MRLGGVLFVGLTLWFAWIDGLLFAFIGALAVAAFVFIVLCHQFVRVDNKVFNARAQELQRQLYKIKNKDERKVAQAELKQALKELKAAQTNRVIAGKNAAVLIALGTLAFPWAGLGTLLALLTFKKSA